MPQILTDEEWTKIRDAGGLRDRYERETRREIDKAIEDYKRARRPTRLIRRKAQQLRDSLEKTSSLLDRVTRSDEFRYCGTDRRRSRQPDFKRLRTARRWLGVTVKEIERTLKRFERVKASVEKYKARPDEPLELFMVEILLIQSEALQGTPPIKPQQDIINPRFQEFVYLCARTADRELKSPKIKRCLAKVTSGFKVIRDDDPFWGTAPD